VSEGSSRAPRPSGASQDPRGTGRARDPRSAGDVRRAGDVTSARNARGAGNFGDAGDARFPGCNNSGLKLKMGNVDKNKTLHMTRRRNRKRGWRRNGKM
jgi:hypothetical protein